MRYGITQLCAYGYLQFKMNRSVEKEVPMRDEDKTKAQLIKELEELRQQVATLETAETERKQLEESLQKSKQLLERTFASLRDAVFIIDAETVKIIDCNPIASEIFGYSREEMVGRTTTFLHVNEATLEEFRSHLYPAVQKKGFLDHLEFSMKRKDGTIFLTEHCVMPLEDEQSKRVGWVSVVRDITERKRTEEALRRRAEELAALQATVLDITAPHELPPLLQPVVERAARLLDTLGGGMYLCDPVQREVRCVVSYNTPRDYTGTVLKYGEGAAGTVAQSGEPLIIDDYRIWPNRAAAFEEEQPFTAVLAAPMIWENRVIGVIDLLRDVTHRGFTQTDLELLTLFANHAAIAVENTRLYEHAQQEITERKKVVEALRKAEQEKAIILNSMSELVAYQDLKMNILWVNRAASESVGVNPEQLVGHRCYEIWHQRNEPCGDCPVMKTRQTGQSQVAEITSPDGRVWFIRGYPVHDAEGDLVGIVEVTLDITDRKQAEEELEHYRHHLETLVEERTAELNKVNAELVRANRLKDEFLATMSHELRTPLHVILGMGESLQEKVYGPLTDRQLKSLQMIEESGRHLLTLINDVLDLSKISTGKLELEIAPVFVESICQTSLRFIKQLAQKKRLKVSSMLDSHVTTIQADGRRLKQVLVNLLSNAVKFTPEGGKVGLEVEGDTDQQAVHFTVWDTGIGIAQEDLERLFQPFVQLDASLSRRYKGTGLGLSLVYRMVEMHGGSVSVESEVGQGSRFTVSLPWQESGDREFGRWEDEESQDIDPHSPISPSPQSRTILIAEDNEATITTLSEYFIAKGDRVLTARNGWEAFAQTREVRPDIIVMDIQMPEMDGLEAIRHIRSDQHGQSIPIIALTALAMPGDQEQCLSAGADEYLCKPVSLRRLSEAIERFLSRKVQK
jgi:PAS domain S-box-containing protein